MSTRVVLHVGTMKSGTSYVQRGFNEAGEQFRERGVLFPGGRFRHQVIAVRDLLGQHREGRHGVHGAWDRLVGEVNDWPGTAVISMELLARASPKKVRPALESFGDAELRVVVTARDLGRVTPAMWQELLKNNRNVGWNEYLRQVEHTEGRGVAYWKEHDLPAIIRRWRKLVGPRNVVLVTVPPSGAPRDLLWQRFCDAAGIDGAGLDPKSSVNESLGAASAALLLRLNDALAEHDLAWEDYAPLVKRRLSKDVLAGHRAAERPIGFRPPRWLVQRSAEMVQTLRERNVRVVGDLADLTPVRVRGVDPTKVRADDQLDAAVAGLAGLLADLVGQVHHDHERDHEDDRDEDDEPLGQDARRR